MGRLRYRNPCLFVEEILVKIDPFAPMTVFAMFTNLMAVLFALRANRLQNSYKSCRFEISIRIRRLLFRLTDSDPVRVTGNLNGAFHLSGKDLIGKVEGSLLWPQ